MSCGRSIRACIHAGTATAVAGVAQVNSRAVDSTSPAAGRPDRRGAAPERARARARAHAPVLEVARVPKHVVDLLRQQLALQRALQHRAVPRLGRVVGVQRRGGGRRLAHRAQRGAAPAAPPRPALLPRAARLLLLLLLLLAVPPRRCRGRAWQLRAGRGGEAGRRERSHRGRSGQARRAARRDSQQMARQQRHMHRWAGRQCSAGMRHTHQSPREPPLRGQHERRLHRGRGPAAVAGAGPGLLPHGGCRAQACYERGHGSAEGGGPASGVIARAVARAVVQAVGPLHQRTAGRALITLTARQRCRGASAGRGLPRGQGDLRKRCEPLHGPSVLAPGCCCACGCCSYRKLDWRLLDCS